MCEVRSERIPFRIEVGEVEGGGEWKRMKENRMCIRDGWERRRRRRRRGGGRRRTRSKRHVGWEREREYMRE